jgi:hypothetical protein
MKRSYTFLSLFILLSCKASSVNETELSETEAWELSYRMFQSSILENHEIGIQQFDSLLQSKRELEPKIINVGLELLNKKNQHQKIVSILQNTDEQSKIYMCGKGWLADALNKEEWKQICAGIKEKELAISHPKLQKELVVMFINDQAVRGGDVSELAKEFNLKVDSISYHTDGVGTDYINRKKLKNILSEYGFPTKSMVGDVGMRSVFFVIQHSDEDKYFQESQLEEIEKAVERGDLEGQLYAYLFDRIQVNAGQKQLYGTQFKNVDVRTKTVELAPVEDMENLDSRRMKMGMVPIKIYKELMLYQAGK